MLLVVPIPLFFELQTSWRRKIRLYLLFTLGIFIIIITVIRLPINNMNIDSQVSRTTWAVTELLTATIVVNAPTMYGFWNKKKQGSTYNHSHESGTLSRNSVRAPTSHRPHRQDLALQPIPYKSGSAEGILRTRETTVTRYAGSDGISDDTVPQKDETEIASNSSQRSILRDLK